MIPKPFTVKKYADFLCGSDAVKASIVKKHKYPNRENVAMAGYYSPAKNAILVFNRRRNGRDWLLQQAVDLETRAMTPNKSLRSKLLCNAKAIRNYEEHFGHKYYSYLKPEKFRFELAGVTVNVTPDVHVIDDGIERYVKFYFGTKKLKYSFITTIVDCMSYGVAECKGADAAQHVAYINLSSGVVHTGNPVAGEVVSEIRRGCEELVKLWHLT